MQNIHRKILGAIAVSVLSRADVPKELFHQRLVLITTEAVPRKSRRRLHAC